MNPKDTLFCKKNTLSCQGQLIDLSVPLVMGILNITPDSFYDGGKYASEKNIIDRAQEIMEQGGKIIDIGAYSSRPGARNIPFKEELSRLMPALKIIKKKFPKSIVSIDTFRSEMVKIAFDHGIDIINDISGGTLDKKMFKTISELKIPYILMHLQGNPKNMQINPSYKDVVGEVIYYFSEKVNELKLLGANDIIIDPGFGFGKDLNHNYELLNHIDKLKILDLPILAGVSRKSMINKVINTQPETALNGTTVLNTILLNKGVSILRVHDVKEAVEAIKIVTFTNQNNQTCFH